MAAVAKSVFPPLDKNSSSIQLLSFKLDDSNQIQADFSIFGISECPPFVALSYMWGTSEAIQYPVFLNGQLLYVRENLWYALQALRDMAKQDAAHVTRTGQSAATSCWGYFWIDAICIDQLDELERSHQVNMMKDIYTRAAAVVAWLGNLAPPETIL